MADWPDLKANWADHEEMVAADFNEYAVRSNEHSEAINNIPNLEIGTVGTSFPGEDASAEIVAGEGEESDQRLLNLIIPRGEQGPPGPVGNLLTFKGPWDASTNTPELADGVGDIGDSWTVEVGATVDLGSGPIAFSVGDWAVYNGYIWVRSTAQNSAIAEAIDNLIAGAPGALDTLNELAAALGDDANFATTIATTLAGKVPTTRTLTAGTGLSGGGDLSANRTLAVSYGTTAGTSAQGNDSRLVPENNVLALGATGDGVTDDTTAIHAARDAAGVGGRVTFPAGTYLVSGLTASVAKQHWVLLDGATIKAKTGATKILSITGAGVRVTGGVFDGSNQTVHDGSQNGVVASAAGITVDRITVQNSPFYGISAFSVGQFRVSNCTVVSSYYSAIWVQNQLTSPSEIDDITVVDNLIDNSSGGNHASGIGIYGPSTTQLIKRVLVRGNIIRLPYNQTDTNTGCIGPYNCTDVVVSENICIGGTISISVPNALRATIANNDVRGFDQLGIELPGTAGGEINNVSVVGNVLDPDGAGAVAGIQTSAGNIKNLAIIGNSIRNFTVGCNLINFGSGSVVNAVTIIGNTLTGTPVSGSFSAITFNGSVTSLTMTGNVIDGNSWTSSYGVLIFRSVSGLSVTGNQFANLANNPVCLASNGAYALDYIRLTGNTYVNCGAPLLNSVAGGATVGAHVFVDGESAIKPQSMVAFGDSIVQHGYTVSGSVLYQDHRAWYAWANAFLGWRFDILNNAGVSGDTLAQMYARISTDVLAYNPTWVWMDGGVNDITASASYATVIARFQQIFDALSAARIRVVCVTITPVTAFNSTQNTIRGQVNQWLRAYGAANSNVIVVDISPVIQDPASNSPATGYSGDGLHPTALGAMAMGWAVSQALDRITVPRSPLTAGTDPTNILGSGGMLVGATSGLATLWKKTESGTGSTYSKLTRADNILGERQRVVTPAGANTSAILLTTDPTTGFAVGDTIYGAVEVQVSGADLTAPAGQLETFIQLSCMDNSSTQLAAAIYGGGSNESETFPLNYSATLRTPNLVVPTGTTKIRFILWSYGGATRDWSRAVVRKV